MLLSRLRLALFSSESVYGPVYNKLSKPSKAKHENICLCVRDTANPLSSRWFLKSRFRYVFLIEPKVNRQPLLLAFFMSKSCRK